MVHNYQLIACPLSPCVANSWVRLTGIKFLLNPSNQEPREKIPIRFYHNSLLFLSVIIFCFFFNMQKQLHNRLSHLEINQVGLLSHEHLMIQAITIS